MTAPEEDLLLCVGNPLRGDDGAGWAVADRLGGRPDLTVARTDGEATRLLDLWDGRALVVVVDAVRGGGAPGTVRVIDPVAVVESAATSTHGAGLAAAIALGRELDRLPDRLVLVGIVGGDFTVGAGLSVEVGAAVAVAAQVAADLLRDGATTVPGYH